MKRRFTVEIRGNNVPFYLTRSGRADFTTDKRKAKPMTREHADDFVERAKIVSPSMAANYVVVPL